MSALAINHNMMAANTANILNRHYGNLATSTQRLSSGLRINSAADDAAGLAIRELMRADIAALNQGVRNVNDAISMIQTFDGALSVIDEKLIRMKELSEQAATGTYTSDQRLMIDSEFQAMASEITRIARATDFNGVKLIDGENGVRAITAAAMGGIAAYASTPSSIKGSDGRNYKVQINATTVEGINITPGTLMSTIVDPAALGAGTHEITLTNNNVISAGTNGQYLFNFTTISNDAGFLGSNIPLNFDSTNTSAPSYGWSITGVDPGDLFIQDVGVPGVNIFEFRLNVPPYNGQSFTLRVTDTAGNNVAVSENISSVTWNPSNNSNPSFNVLVNSPSITQGQVSSTAVFNDQNMSLNMTINLGGGNSINQQFTLPSTSSTNLHGLKYSISIVDVTQPTDPGTGPNPNPDDPNSPFAPDYVIPDDVVRIHFGPGADSREDFYDIKKYDATIRGLGLDGVKIETQEAAQKALVQINDAIVAKDKIRADYGAMQNRLENTAAVQTIQSENLQNSESRISDVDVATEMTNFVRNQILTQSSVAMLAQANSFPQMVMSLVQ